MAKLTDVEAKNPLMYNPLTAPGVFVADKLGFGSKDKTAEAKKKAYAARSSDQHQPDNPYWTLQGKDNDDKSWAYDGFYKFFGRAPTEVELAKIIPAYKGTDRNITDVATGDAFVAQMFDQYENTPEKQYAKQQEAYKQGAVQHYGTIDQMFQQTVGRTATQDEKDHFGSLLASGQVDNYQIGQFLSQLPETVRKQDEQFRQTLNTELQGQDQRYFSEQVMPGIQSNFAQQGRSVDATGFQNSLAQAATQQNRQRESFLANLSAQQYGGSQSNAREDYMNTLGRYQGLQDYGRQRTDYLSDQLTNRGYDIQNFNMQKQMYDDYLRRYGKRSSGVGSFAGGLLGAGLGFGVAGPGGGMAGAQAGYGIGSGLGGIFG